MSKEEGQRKADLLRMSRGRRVTAVPIGLVPGYPRIGATRWGRVLYDEETLQRRVVVWEKSRVVYDTRWFPELTATQKLVRRLDALVRLYCPEERSLASRASILGIARKNYWEIINLRRNPSRSAVDELVAAWNDSGRGPPVRVLGQSVEVPGAERLDPGWSVSSTT